ncbi:MAG: hypothetical protein KAQ79_02895 [Cyclobacteriaceae bacterium]|nr:hypothetical protein [Cyclobacteriaceae bacterium]
MEKVKKSVLLVLAFFVFLLVTGGEYANNLLEEKAQVIADLSEENDDAIPNGAELSFDIFNSVIQVSHLVFHSDLIFEFDFPEISETKPHSVFNTALNYTKYYKTLFRSIISPNAP